MARPNLIAHLLAVALPCALPAVAGGVGWDVIGASPYSRATVSDGERFVAFQSDDRHVAVLDTAPGNGITTYRIPDACASDGYAFVGAIGDSQLLVSCVSPSTGTRPLLLTLGLGVWHEVPVPASPPGQGTYTSFDVIGAHWIRRSTDPGARSEWLNWHTGEVQAVSADERRIPDPDSPDLWISPCPGVDPVSSTYVYEPPFAAVQRPGKGLRLQRCGESRSLPLDPAAEKVYGLRLAGDIVTWSALGPFAHAGAHLIGCHVSLLWRQPSGGSLVHTGRTLVRTFVMDRYGNPGLVVGLQLPVGCPPSWAKAPLHVGLPGRRGTAVRPYGASWRTSDSWGDAQARIMPGTFLPTRILLRSGTPLAVVARNATRVRWRDSGGSWHDAQGTGARFSLARRALPRHLQLAVRFADDARATYRIELKRRRR